MPNELERERTRVRRADRAVDDDAWIAAMLATAPFGTLATAAGGEPSVNTNIFAFAEGERAIYMHTSQAGRTSGHARDGAPACFTVSEMGRLLPHPRAFNMSIEYASVVAFGRIDVLEGDAALGGLRLLLAKYFPHLRYGDDYAPPDAGELKLTSVYRFAIGEWSGKRKEVADDYAGAFGYSAASFPQMRRSGVNS